MIDWRKWLFEKLKSSQEIQGLVGDRIHSMVDDDMRPFIVIRMTDTSANVADAIDQDVVIWVHDDPHSYTRIDEILAEVRAIIEGVVTDQDGIEALWQGDSQDLADDARGTVLRTSSYRLVGRR